MDRAEQKEKIEKELDDLKETKNTLKRIENEIIYNQEIAAAQLEKVIWIYSNNSQVVTDISENLNNLKVLNVNTTEIIEDEKAEINIRLIVTILKKFLQLSC